MRMSIKIFLLFIIVLLITAAIALAYLDKVDKLNNDATVEWKLDNMQEAISLYKQASQWGSTTARKELITIYGAGISIQPDREKALYYLKKLNYNDKMTTISTIVYCIKNKIENSQATDDDLIFWETKLAKMEK